VLITFVVFWLVGVVFVFVLHFSLTGDLDRDRLMAIYLVVLLLILHSTVVKSFHVFHNNNTIATPHRFIISVY